MVEPEEYSYEEFPESSTVTRGMNIIKFEDDIASVVCKRYVNYVERDGKQLKLQLVALIVLSLLQTLTELQS